MLKRGGGTAAASRLSSESGSSSSESLRSTAYAWTAAAWAAYQRFHGRDPHWLPWYAIPADKVRAEAGAGAVATAEQAL